MMTRVVISTALILLCGCPEDEPSDTGSTSSSSNTTEGGDGETTQTPATTTGVDGSSTGTAEGGSTTDPTGDSDSTTGDPIGCEPGSPCCNDAGEFEECFLDEANGLVWELDPGGGNPNLEDAGSYCSQLALLGSSGWRVPTLDELRTLVRGCSDTEAGGGCELGEACATTDCRNAPCDGCMDAPNEGPGMFGCYWNPNLLGSCDRYWTTTDPGGGLGWLVDFDDASIRQADAGLPAGRVRCVASLE